MSNAILGQLPVPRIPVRSLPPATAVENIVGEQLATPLHEFEAAAADAHHKVRLLERCRPGAEGSLWRQALADDYDAGKRPDEWRAARLLKTDPDRWADAQMACRFVPIAAARCNAALNKAAISKAAHKVADAHAKVFNKAAATGWKNVENNKPEAWAQFKRGTEALAAYRAAREVAYWADGQAYDGPDKVGYLTTDGVACGHWITLEAALNPSRGIKLTTPGGTIVRKQGQPEVRTSSDGGVVYPDGAHKFLGIPKPNRLKALRTKGYAELEDQGGIR